MEEADRRPSARPPPLGVGAVLRVVAAGILGFGAGLGALGAIAGGPPTPGSPSAAWAQALALGAAATAAVAADPRRAWPLGRRLGLFRVPAGAVALALAGGLALQLPLAAVAVAVERVAPTPAAVREVLERLVAPDGWQGWLASGVALVLVAPLAEEVVFRGLLLRGLLPRLGPVPAAASTSLLFGAAHGTPSSVVYATLAGLVLAALALRARSIVPGIVAHAGVNAAPMLLAASGRGGTEAPLADLLDAVPAPIALGGLAVAAPALLGAARLAGRRRPGGRYGSPGGRPAVGAGTGSTPER